MATSGTYTVMWEAGTAELIVFFAAHALYGAAVGVLYERVRMGPPPLDAPG